MAIIQETTEAPATIRTSYRMAPGDEFRGLVDRRHADWIGIELEAGLSYEIALKGFGDGGDALVDPFLTVFDARGQLLDLNDDQDDGAFGIRDSLLVFTAPATDLYFLEAESWSNSAGGTYALTVRIDQHEVGDAAADTTTTAAFGETGRVTGTISTAGDRDWFAIELAPQTAYRIDLFGGQFDPLFDPAFTLYDSTGAKVVSNDDGGGGLDAALIYTTDVGGTYYLEARSAQEGPADIGTYSARMMMADVSGPSRFGTQGSDIFIDYRDFERRDLSLNLSGGHDFADARGAVSYLYGQAGNDTLYGGARSDFLSGGRGDDVIRGGPGIDRVKGGAGDDLLFGGGGDDKVSASAGSDTLTGGDGSDRFLVGGRAGDNIITDFDPAEDTLRLSTKSIGAVGLDGDDILDRYAEVQDGDLVLTFKWGMTLTLEGITDTEAMAAAIL